MVLQCVFLIFHVFHCFLPYCRSYSVCFQFLIFFRVSHLISCPTMWVSHFPRFSVSHHIPCPTVCISPFSRFFTVSGHFPGPTVYVFHFARFSMFLAIFRFLPWFSHFPRLSVLSTYSRSYSACFFVFHVFQGFSPYSSSYPVFFAFFFFVTFLAVFQFLYCAFSFFIFSVFLGIFQVIQCLCLIFHVFYFFHQNPGPTVCIYHISSFSLFLAIFQVLLFVFLYGCFQCLLPYFMSYHVSYSHFSFFRILAISRSYSVWVTFSTFFSVYSLQSRS